MLEILYLYSSPLRKVPFHRRVYDVELVLSTGLGPQVALHVYLDLARHHDDSLDRGGERVGDEDVADLLESLGRGRLARMRLI